MRWNGLTPRARKVVGAMLTVVSFPVWGPVFGLMFVLIWIERQWFILPTAWTRRFAVIPTRINEWDDPNEGRWFWLEWVEGRYLGGCNEYRTPTNTEHRV